MRLTEVYEGNNDPFEGDRTIWLRSLPAGARVTNARVKLTPVARAGGTKFEENINFPNGQGDFGATKTTVARVPDNLATTADESVPGWVEVDFHARRMLAKITGSGGASILQVDMGGTFIGIANDGTFMDPDKTAFTVTLLSTASALPSLTVSKFKLTQAAGNTTDLDVTEVTIRSVPTNLIVRLGQLPSFWTRLGELVNEDTSPDFALLLNTFIAEAQPQNGFYQIPFTIHSDTIARLRIELNIDYVIEQAVLPPHLSEVKLPYNFSTLPGVEDVVTTVALPRGAVPVNGKTNAQIRGEFQPTRVALGAIGEEPATFLVLVSPQCSLAQAVQSDTEIEVIGIDVPLGNTQPGLAGIHVAIQSDADGKPFGEILASAEVRVEKPLPGQSTWGSATLQETFRILPNVRYWLVLQSQIGQAYWKATADTSGGPPLQCTRDGALSWRAATVTGGPANLAALFRLRHRPERFSVPVQLQIGKGPEAVRRRLDEFAPLGRIEFNFDFAEKLTEHLSKPGAASPCGSGELLINGDFNDPPPDDATRRLFGEDSKSSESETDPDNITTHTIEGTVDLGRGVDLSIERFITISLAGVDDIRLDCAGANPSRTSLEEIVATINRRAGHLSIIAEGDVENGRLRLHSPNSFELRAWQETDVPAGWQGTVGKIFRARVPAPNIRESIFSRFGNHIVAILSQDGTVPVVLAQRVPAAGGCSYRLHIPVAFFRSKDFLSSTIASVEATTGAILQTLDFDQPRWEVRWLDANSQIIREDSQSFGFGAEVFVASVEFRLSAPAGAVAAEIRVVLPEGTLALDSVSFAPALETLSNSTFGAWQIQSTNGPPIPQAWTINSGFVDRDTETAGALLRGDADVPEDTVLSQTTPIIAGETYKLNIRAAPSLPPTANLEMQPITNRARFELRWLNDAGPPSAPIIMPLDGRDFFGHGWRGLALTGATQAEIKLIQPKNGNSLLAKSVSLRRIDFVRVPLIFLAETPGELTAANFRVTFDMAEPESEPSSSVPSAASRADSPVVSEPIDIDEECEEDRACEKTSTMRSQPAASLEVIQPLAMLVKPAKSSQATTPLTEIGGIGKGRAQRLTKMGIDSVEKLARAEPKKISKALGISSESAAKFIAAAKALLL